MLEFKNIDINKIVGIDTSNENHKKILKIVDGIIEIIINPEKLQNEIQIHQVRDSILSVYSSICIFLSETRDIMIAEIDVDELTYQYMLMNREIIQNKILTLPSGLFGGLAEVGMAAHSLYKTTSNYKKFIDKLNEFIIKTSREKLEEYKCERDNVKIRYYDTMSGLAGIVGYLMLYKEDKGVSDFIKEVLEYFTLLTTDKQVGEHRVPSYHISAENHVSIKESPYKNGYFNFGISHGISGPLSILSLALLEDIEVEGQKEAIVKILNNLHIFTFKCKNNGVYWPGIVGFDDYTNNTISHNASRASWCYGTPGIARAMFLAAKAVDRKDSLDLSIEAIKELCNMDIKDWGLNSPTMCHGYSGILAVFEAMSLEIEDTDLRVGINKATDAVLSYYNEKILFGFTNIEVRENDNNDYELVEENSLSLLSGSIGVALTLLSTLKPIKTCWMRHFFLDKI